MIDWLASSPEGVDAALLSSGEARILEDNA
jgi:hypothetical protein